jgi:beta-glucosidase
MSSATTGIPGEESGLVGRLTLEQKVRLLTGHDSWVLYGAPAAGLRPMVLSDGPAGVRGTRFDRGDPSSSLPCGVGLAATWDERLIQSVARALGREARAKGVDVLLGPTVNIVRTPLAGRGFECFSEDPLLTSRIAVAYVRGVQEAGVGATAKHYVGNDSETERRTYDARIAEHVLRELYLPPFEACVTEADVAMVMAAYNSVNGATMTAHRTLLTELLKGEWGFPGVVVSDWSATTTTVASAVAGLDLVMPGPKGPWGDLLLAAVRAGRVPESAIDDKVARLLAVAQRVGALEGGEEPPAPANREPIDPDLLREVTARSFTVLANHRGLLPLDRERITTLAVIGPNALHPITQGGGSVRVLAVARPGIAESLRSALGGGAEVVEEEGCSTSATVPLPPPGSLRDPVSGEPGVRLEIHAAGGELVHDVALPSSVLTWWDGLPDAVNVAGSEVVMRARYRAEVDGPHVLGAAATGLVRIAVDGVRLGEARTLPARDVVEALSRPPELRVPVQLRAGQEVEVRVEHRPDVRGRYGFVTMRLGVAPRREDDDAIADAVAAASAADVALVVVGSADGTESEGYDRESLALPGRQDELVARVAAANPNTVVVVNTGMPVLMPWVGEVAAVVQAWLPGQAFGEALADALLGVIEPSGRLPVSMPRQEADSPVLHAHPEGGELPYDEGLLVGYRGYDRKGTEPLFCFGHGLGYTDWTYRSLAVGSGSPAAGEDLRVRVTLSNSGGRAGREVVQLYLQGPDDDASRPLRTLAAFATVDAEPGQSVDAELTVPARAFARYDEGLSRWVWPAGEYTIHAGRSSRDLRLSASLTLLGSGPSPD